MDFASLKPLPGGWSGQTFVAQAGGERSVVRIYAASSLRGDGAHEVDAALLRLVRGLLPVPEVLEVRRADPVTQMPALLVTSFLPGVRGDELMATLDADGLTVLGRNIGALTSTLAGMPMPRAGIFVDGELRTKHLPASGLPEWVDAHAPRLSNFDADELAGLRDVAEFAQHLQEQVGRRCLVHGDLNPKNLLVDPDSLEITGLVDWEFAHGGHPFTDLGNVLRFDRYPAYVDAVIMAYVERRGSSVERVLEQARAADLWALVDLAARFASAPDNLVAALAHELLRAIAGARDLHAVQPD